MNNIRDKEPESASVEGCCFGILIFLSILFVVQSMMASFGDLTDKDFQRYKDNSAQITPQMEEIEQSLPLIENRIETMENLLPKVEAGNPKDEPEK